MAYHLESNELDHSTAARGLHSSASLIHVAASEQLAAGALHHCPVCGLPYLSESLLTPPRQTAITPGERLVFVCAQCGTYSVGVLDASPQA
ncbi:MAG TPA: hypothetical protein VKT82_34000 [Ktedonobacterales bacterium]|nr:hypothetical protein [Ktedonobacterales bacterium]